MNLIIGGAFQGKTDYARARFSLKNEDIFVCTTENAPDFSKKCLKHLEEFALFALRRGEEPRAVLEDCRDQWAGSVLILNDISCGVVPMEAETRAWREACGRMAAYLAGEADTVTRLFCGIPQVLKGGGDRG